MASLLQKSDPWIEEAFCHASSFVPSDDGVNDAGDADAESSPHDTFSIPQEAPHPHEESQNTIPSGLIGSPPPIPGFYGDGGNNNHAKLPSRQSKIVQVIYCGGSGWNSKPDVGARNSKHRPIINSKRDTTESETNHFPPYIVVHDGKHSTVAFLSSETMVGLGYSGVDDESSSVGDDSKDPRKARAARRQARSNARNHGSHPKNRPNLNKALISISNYTVSTILLCTGLSQHRPHLFQEFASSLPKYIFNRINRNLFMCLYVSGPITFIGGENQGLIGRAKDIHTSVKLRQALQDHDRQFRLENNGAVASASNNDFEKKGMIDDVIREDHSHLMLTRRLEACHCLYQLLAKKRAKTQQYAQTDYPWPWKSRLGANETHSIEVGKVDRFMMGNIGELGNGGECGNGDRLEDVLDSDFFNSQSSQNSGAKEVRKDGMDENYATKDSFTKKRGENTDKNEEVDHFNRAAQTTKGVDVDFNKEKYQKEVSHGDENHFLTVDSNTTQIQFGNVCDLFQNYDDISEILDLPPEQSFTGSEHIPETESFKPVDVAFNCNDSSEQSSRSQYNTQPNPSTNDASLSGSSACCAERAATPTVSNATLSQHPEDGVNKSNSDDSKKTEHYNQPEGDKHNIDTSGANDQEDFSPTGSTKQPMKGATSSNVENTPTSICSEMPLTQESGENFASFVGIDDMMVDEDDESCSKHGNKSLGEKNYSEGGDNENVSGEMAEHDIENAECDANDAHFETQEQLDSNEKVTDESLKNFIENLHHGDMHSEGEGKKDKDTEEEKRKCDTANGHSSGGIHPVRDHEDKDIDFHTPLQRPKGLNAENVGGCLSQHSNTQIPILLKDPKEARLAAKDDEADVHYEPESQVVSMIIKHPRKKRVGKNESADSQDSIALLTPLLATRGKGGNVQEKETISDNNGLNGKQILQPQTLPNECHDNEAEQLKPNSAPIESQIPITLNPPNSPSPSDDSSATKSIPRRTNPTIDNDHLSFSFTQESMPGTITSSIFDSPVDSKEKSEGIQDNLMDKEAPKRKVSSADNYDSDDSDAWMKVYKGPLAAKAQSNIAIIERWRKLRKDAQEKETAPQQHIPSSTDYNSEDSDAWMKVRKRPKITSSRLRLSPERRWGAEQIHGEKSDESTVVSGRKGKGCHSRVSPDDGSVDDDISLT